MLEQLTVEHAPLALRLYGDPRVSKYLGGNLPQTLEEEVRALKRHTENTWGVYNYGLMVAFVKADRSFAGICGLLHWDLDGQEETEVAYALVPECWGKGYATEAAIAVADDAITRLGCSRLISLVMPDNTASINVALKNGMTFERQSTLFGKVVNVYSKKCFDKLSMRQCSTE